MLIFKFSNYSLKIVIIKRMCTIIIKLFSMIDPQQQHLQGHFSFQVAGKVVDEKLLWWKPKEFLEGRICLRRPHIYLQITKINNYKRRKPSARQKKKKKQKQHIGNVDFQSRISHVPSSPPLSPSYLNIL